MPCYSGRRRLSDSCTRRITYFDGLRGVACIQVVACHYAIAFYPAMTLGLGFLTDGTFAVCIFFLLSGYVLTQAFAASTATPLTLIVRRLLRLCLPAYAAVVISGLMESPGQNNAAIAHAAVGWPASFPTPLFAGPGFPYDLSGTEILFGYRNTWPLYASWLPAGKISVDSPLWTMSIEIMGSLLVLALVLVRRHARRAHLLSIISALVLFREDYLVLFVLSHGIAVMGHKTSPGRRAVLTPIFLMLAAVLLCSGYHPIVLNNYNDKIAAVLFFLGVLTAPWLQNFLRGPIPQFIGTVSFPTYLLHYPVLVLAGSTLFLALYPLGHWPALIISWAGGTVLTLGLAMVFERFVDAPVIRLSHRVALSWPFPAARLTQRAEPGAGAPLQEPQKKPN